MGRVKLKIKRLESGTNRQVTYSKRKNGIVKKAKELSILCDIDIVLLMFSPNGKPTMFNGARSSMEEVISKFAQLTPQERAKRKLESLETLKKTFKKLDHDVNIHDFLETSGQTAEELMNQVRLLQAQLTEVHRKLSCWSEVEKIDNVEHLRQMEDSLSESLHRIRIHKENITKHQFMPLECTSQFQNGIQTPLMIGGLPEAQPLTWLPTDGNQHMMGAENLNFLPQTYMGFSRDASVSAYAGYFGNCKHMDIDNSRGQVENAGGHGGSLNDLTGSGSFTLQLKEQYPYSAYDGGLNFPDEKGLKSEIEINMPGIPLDYQVNSNFTLPRPTYDNNEWAPMAGPCAITMFPQNPHPKQPN